MTESIGQIIAKTRSQKKLTLEQVYRALCIKEKYLLAIEEDRFEDLPSLVQGRGFIRMYWDYFNLPPKELDDLLLSDKSSLKLYQADVTGKKGEISQGNLVPSSVQDNPPYPSAFDHSKNILKDGAQKLLSEIGNDLKKQRNRLSLSTTSIEEITHIPLHYVIALEEGRFDELPSSVQYKGMLNNYAGFLDLDTEAILLKYAEALQLKREEALLLTESKQKKRLLKVPNPGGMPKQGLPTARSLISLDIFVVIILVIITFASLIWGASAIVSYQVDPRATKTAQAQIDALIHAATVEAGLTPTTMLELPTTETVTVVIPVDRPTLTFAAPAASGSPVSVFFVANQSAYMQVIVDGKVTFNGRLTPGNPYLFEGKKQIELICGNAAAIQVIFNQTDLGNLGPQGSVIHLIFDINSFGTPTFTPSVTPSATLKPSKTPKPSNTYPPTKTKLPTSTPYPTRTRTPTRTPTQ
jgi:cytoskeleton protein RodZ